jgi:hypothetical protein
MRVQRQALLLVAVAAALTAVSTGGAGAQKFYGRDGAQNFHVSRPSMPTRPGRDGGHHHWHHGGWHGPGIVVAIPPGSEIINDGPDQYVAHRPRQPRQRTTTTPRGPSGAPPANERRYLPDEVVIEVANSVSAAQIDALQRRFRLTRIESHTFQLSGTTLLRWRIPDRRSVASVVRALEGNALVAAAQPNYLFALQQSNAKPASEGDPAQYALAKLRQARTIAKGGQYSGFWWR